MSVLGDLIAQGQQLLSEAARGSEATKSAIEHWPQRVGNTSVALALPAWIVATLARSEKGSPFR